MAHGVNEGQPNSTLSSSSHDLNEKVGADLVHEPPQISERTKMINTYYMQHPEQIKAGDELIIQLGDKPPEESVVITDSDLKGFERIPFQKQYTVPRSIHAVNVSEGKVLTLCKDGSIFQSTPDYSNLKTTTIETPRTTETPRSSGFTSESTTSNFFVSKQDSNCFAFGCQSGNILLYLSVEGEPFVIKAAQRMIVYVTFIKIYKDYYLVSCVDAQKILRVFKCDVVKKDTKLAHEKEYNLDNTFLSFSLLNDFTLNSPTSTAVLVVGVVPFNSEYSILSLNIKYKEMQVETKSTSVKRNLVTCVDFLTAVENMSPGLILCGTDKGYVFTVSLSGEPNLTEIIKINSDKKDNSVIKIQINNYDANILFKDGSLYTYLINTSRNEEHPFSRTKSNLNINNVAFNSDLSVIASVEKNNVFIWGYVLVSFKRESGSSDSMMSERFIMTQEEQRSKQSIINENKDKGVVTNEEEEEEEEPALPDTTATKKGFFSRVFNIKGGVTRRKNQKARRKSTKKQRRKLKTHHRKVRKGRHMLTKKK